MHVSLLTGRTFPGQTRLDRQHGLDVDGGAASADISTQATRHVRPDADGRRLHGLLDAAGRLL